MDARIKSGHDVAWRPSPCFKLGVIPAQAGIQRLQAPPLFLRWMPVFTGMTVELSPPAKPPLHCPHPWPR